MKHVRAEVIKALAEDNSLTVEAESGDRPGVWLLVASDRTKIIGWVAANPYRAIRIKPQPKAISWTNMYRSGLSGFGWSQRDAADEEASQRKGRIAVVEVRDDGTAHLHKVEA